MNKEISHYLPIYDSGEQIGNIQLVWINDYTIPMLEYQLDKAFRGKGIMSNFISSYLFALDSSGIDRLVAQVKKGNIASQKILLKNKFFKILESRDGKIDFYCRSIKLI